MAAGADKQRSRELGIQLAKALVEHAFEHRRTSTGPVDPHDVVLGAAEYLDKKTAFWREPPLDPNRVADEHRRN